MVTGAAVMTGAVGKLAIFACGLYIGKYYPHYVPLPQINRANIDAVLRRLEELASDANKPR